MLDEKGWEQIRYTARQDARLTCRLSRSVGIPFCPFPSAGPWPVSAAN